MFQDEVERISDRDLAAIVRMVSLYGHSVKTWVNGCEEQVRICDRLDGWEMAAASYELLKQVYEETGVRAFGGFPSGQYDPNYVDNEDEFDQED